MRISRLSEYCFIGVVAAVFLRRRRLACRFTEINERRGSVRFGICAVFMPAVLGCGYWLRSVVGDIMPYSRVGGNKNDGFGALVNCRVAAFWFFYYREADSSLALIGV